MYTNNTIEQISFAIDVEETFVSPTEKKRVFQAYNNRQMMMILDIEQYIPEHHIARAVDEMVESIPDSILEEQYVGGGRAPYHPKMLLKVLLYAYTQKTYSSRTIEAMLKENLPMMWLATMQKPDHRTINDFRGIRMPKVMDAVFEQFLLQLVDEGLIDLQHLFVDGTKIEENANKYSFVWAKAVNNYDKKLKEKIAALLEEVKAVTAQEMATMTLEEQLEQTTDSLQQEVIELEKAIEQEVDKEQKKALRRQKSGKKKQVKAILEDYLPRLEKYEQHRQLLGERNSYSKTDSDATFMRMKDDHMKNGQLKAAYNVQMATQNQYIVGFELFQRPGDTRCFQPFMEKLLARDFHVPEVVVADAGYASEQNYLYTLGEEKEEQVENPRFQLLTPYNTYLKEKKRSFKNEKKNVKNWTYIEEDDVFICPNEQRVVFKKYQKRKQKMGSSKTTKFMNARTVAVAPSNPNVQKLKAIAKYIGIQFIKK